ncbi:TorD/DmsD family molecular chaperone [Tessaracoccus sp.]
MTAEHRCTCAEESSQRADVHTSTLDADQADALAAVWTVLARVLAEPPSADALQQLRSPQMLQDWPLLDGPQSTPDVLADALESLAESRRADEDATVVADDHMRLLRGPGTALACPYESVHRSREHLVFERETLEVRHWYSRFGLQAPKLDREPDDQIHLELEFCATLLRRGLDALERNDEARSQMFFAAHHDFCREHLLAWAPAFFDQVRDGARTHFYAGVAGLGRHALKHAQLLVEPESA